MPCPQIPPTPPPPPPPPQILSQKMDGPLTGLMKRLKGRLFITKQRFIMVETLDGETLTSNNVIAMSQDWLHFLKIIDEYFRHCQLEKLHSWLVQRLPLICQVSNVGKKICDIYKQDLENRIHGNDTILRSLSNANITLVSGFYSKHYCFEMCFWRPAGLRS